MGQISRIRDFDDPLYDPFNALATIGGEDQIRDIYPELARLRTISPVYNGDLRAHFGLKPDLTMSALRHFAILGHDEVSEVLRDQTMYSNRIYDHNLGIYFGRSITTMDQPDHGRYRRMFQRAFYPSVVQLWADTLIPRMIQRLLNDFAERGTAELVSEFSLKFPFHFIHELMALPVEDRLVFHKLAFGQINLSFDPVHAADAAEKLKTYITELVTARRAEPIEDDFVSTIASVEVDGEHLPDEIVISFFRQLMNAAGDTGYNGFSSILAGLLTNPEQLDQVTNDRSLVDGAIEEGLRWNCPVPFIPRTPTREIELAGVTLRPGDDLQVSLGGANRDPKAFQDPDKFDIRRRKPVSFAFGYGPHICIGRHLARLEMGIALNMLLDRFPRLRLDPDYPAPEVCGFMLRKPPEVRVLLN